MNDSFMEEHRPPQSFCCRFAVMQIARRAEPRFPAGCFLHPVIDMEKTHVREANDDRSGRVVASCERRVRRATDGFAIVAAGRLASVEDRRSRADVLVAVVIDRPAKTP